MGAKNFFRALIVLGLIGVALVSIFIYRESLASAVRLVSRESRSKVELASYIFRHTLRRRIERLKDVAVSIERWPNLLTIRTIFRRFYAETGGRCFLAVEWADARGYIVEGFPPEHTPYGFFYGSSKSAWDYFLRIKKADNVVISKSIRLFEGKVGLAIAYPVRSEGKFIGAVVMVLTYDEHLGPQVFGKDRFILIDADNEKIVYASEYLGLSGKKFFSEILKNKKLQGGNCFSVESNLLGRKVLFSVEKISYAGRNWYIAYYVPFRAILEAAYRMRVISIIGIFLSLFIVGANFLSLKATVKYEKKLEEERDSLGRVLGALGNPLLVFDRSGRVRFYNNVAREIFGNEIEGRPCPFMMLPSSSCMFHEKLGEEESGPITQEFEYKGRTFEVTCMSIKNEDGEIEGTISVMRDITDNKRFEARLWQLARRLERKIWEEHMLFELSRLVAMRKRRRDFIKETLDLIYAYFPVLLVFIASVDERWRVLKVEEVIGGKKEVKSLLLSERGLSRVIDSGEIFYLPDTRGMRSLSRAFGVEALSELILPLRVRGGVKGVLFLGSEKINAFSDEDRSVLKAASDIAAIGIENISLYEKLEELAITDDLTGLYNRRFFYRRLSEEIARAQRQGIKLVLMILDLDNFKLYNDTFGHLAGDRLLRLFGQLLSRNIRKGMDYAFRYGGDEFIVLLTAVSVNQAVKIAQRILNEFEMYEYEIVGLSIGIAEYKPGMTEENLIFAADAALYEAKKRGKGRIVVYEGSSGFSTASSESSSDISDSSISSDES